MATSDKITAAIYESNGKKFKIDSKFLLFKHSTATEDHLELYLKKNVYTARYGLKNSLFLELVTRYASNVTH